MISIFIDLTLYVIYMHIRGKQVKTILSESIMLFIIIIHSLIKNNNSLRAKTVKNPGVYLYHLLLKILISWGEVFISYFLCTFNKERIRDDVLTKAYNTHLFLSNNIPDKHFTSSLFPCLICTQNESMVSIYFFKYRRKINDKNIHDPE